MINNISLVNRGAKAYRLYGLFLCACFIFIFTLAPFTSYVYGLENESTPDIPTKSTIEEETLNRSYNDSESVDRSSYTMSQGNPTNGSTKTINKPNTSVKSSANPGNPANASDPTTSNYRSKSSVQLVMELIAEIFGGKATSPEEQKRSQCAALPELEKYLAQYPEYNKGELDAYRKECATADNNSIDNEAVTNIESNEMGIDLSTPIPAGRCTNLAKSATDKVLSSSRLLNVYKKAAAESGLPWEVLAAIHNMETGGKMSENGSLVSGRIIGVPEPDIGKICFTKRAPKSKYTVELGAGECGFDSLENSAYYAAEHFKEKMVYARAKVGAGASEFAVLSATFSLYNGPGNTQCMGNNTKWQASGYRGCPAKFLFEDHLYPFACFDQRHEQMYVIYCGDGRQCTQQTSYSNIGAMTLVKALQQRLGSVASQPKPTLTEDPLCTKNSDKEAPCFSKETNEARYMVRDIKSVCSNSTINASNANCINQTGLKPQPKAIIRNSAAAFTNLQCVGYTFATALEINGVDPQQYGNACDQARSSPTYKFIPRTSGPPEPGDLIIWNSKGNICTSANVGHIAYISKVYNSNKVEVTEANYAAPGMVGIRNVDIDPLTTGWLRKR